MLVRRTRGSETGAAAIILSLFVAFLLIPLGAISVDIARWYVEAERVQAAADAASTAGVTHMPEDFAAAKARALEIAEDNGYKHGTNATVTVTLGDRPTQLRVTVASAVQNQFGRALGIESTTMSRSAVADFTGPAPMGSPCTTFGNEPLGTVLQGPVTQTAAAKAPTLATCTSTPQFWGAISGPDVYKGQGSQFETRQCGADTDGCASSASGAANKEFDPRGYIYMVRVGQGAVGSQVDLQIFDPAYNATYSLCKKDSTGYPTGSTTLTNTFNNHVTDGQQRYASGTGAFCVGDDPSESNRFGTKKATTTSFALRQPVDTLNPFQAPVQSGCIKQFPGTDEGSVTRNALNKGNTSNYNDKFARGFRQWVSLCTFTPTKAGDYYLQVRTNVETGGTLNATTGVYSGNSAVVDQVGDNAAVRGTGINNFGVRAVSSAPAGGVSVASWERMRIFANADSATTVFNLVRVMPSAQGKTLVVTFFDVGEGASSGAVKFLAPADSNMASTTISNCQGAGVKTGTLTACEITGITSSNYNGKLQTVRIPIPATYTCTTSSVGGCWWRAQVKFGTGTVTDATTWTARISGEPVRLIE